MNSIFTKLIEAAVIGDFKATGKSELLEFIAGVASEQYGLDAARLMDSLDEREKLGSTGFGGGTAIPHCKYDGIDEPIAVFVRMTKPIDYKAVDENEVDLIFALISPVDDGAAHLRALAEASRMLRDQDSCAQLRGAEDAAAIFSLLTLNQERDAA